MFVIGFELEFISVYNRIELYYLLKNEFSKYKLKIVEDVTISSTKKMPYRHEIVTPPLPDSEAMILVANLFTFLQNNKCVANKTTGFHVNVSFAEKSLNKWLNPLHIVDSLDYNAILTKWSRSNNKYCRSFDFYFDIIRKAVKLKYKDKNWSDPYGMMHYTHDEVQRASEIKFISMVADCSEKFADPYTIKAYDLWDVGSGKHVCINLHYLKYRGYVEFRMIGGTKYLTNFDSVKEDIDTILESMTQAIKRSMTQ